MLVFHATETCPFCDRDCYHSFWEIIRADTDGNPVTCFQCGRALTARNIQSEEKKTK